MMVGLEHLSEEERQERENRLEACIQAEVASNLDDRAVGDRHIAKLWSMICKRTKDWSERLALVDAHLCVVVSLGEMMVSKGVFGQRHVETAASLLSEFLVFEQTTVRKHRVSCAKLLKDRLSDISLGAGEGRALRLLALRVDMELELLGEAG